MRKTHETAPQRGSRYGPKGTRNGRGRSGSFTRSTVITDEAKGLLIFDVAAGRLVRNEFKAKLTGTMTIAVGDQNAQMGLKQETETKIRVLKDMPKGD